VDLTPGLALYESFRKDPTLGKRKVWCNWEKLWLHKMGTPNFPKKKKEKVHSSPLFSLLGACLSSLIGFVKLLFYKLFFIIFWPGLIPLS
jgi:hypothetical protein